MMWQLWRLFGPEDQSVFSLFDYSSVNILLPPVDAAAVVMDAFIKAD